MNLIVAHSVLGLLIISPLASAESGSAVDMQNKTCIDYDCHADLQSKAIVHGPINEGNCYPCHIQLKPDLHQFQLSHKTEELCYVCHILSTRNHVHQPVADGDCIGCHDPHQSDFQFFLWADPSKDLCLICHGDAPFMKKQNLHEPVAGGACILCHESHSSWKPKLLVAQGNELCMPCHEERIQLDKQMRHVHPALDGDCVNCHDPHSSDLPDYVLDEPAKLCVRCHAEIEQLIAESRIVHSPLNQQQQCENCHYAHSSMLPKLLRKSSLDICLTCHDREITLKDGRTVGDMVALLKENPNHHGPIKQADCSSCHDPHASSHFSLLRQAYPELFYAPFDLNNYKLCFNCHRSELVSSKNGVGLTQFRDGELNLHYVHVNRESRGRTCRACHAVHASKKHAHMSESVPYGQWQYKVSFELKDNGGSCGSACHKAREYDRAKATPIAEPPDDSTPVE
ncbi:MAG: cytochrome c3 family protein [Planctomycetota bacterium]